MSESDDEPITLSAHALAALTQFNSERAEHQVKFEKLQAEAERKSPLSMAAFEEDWNKSQFWYSDNTANVLALELLDGATGDMTIGVISAPSVFVTLMNLLRERDDDQKPRLLLLENDRRFNIFQEFVFYDFQQPLNLPETLKGNVDRIICDPPFLSEDCQTKAALTVQWLKSGGAEVPPRVIVCTGERMKHLVTKLYQASGVRTTTFEPKHERGLSNEFYCYANYESRSWQWRYAIT